MKTRTISAMMAQQPQPLPVVCCVKSLPFPPDVEEEWSLEYEIPDPGKPTVDRIPCLPKLIVAPGAPTEVDIPDLLKFSLTPGSNLTELRNRQPTPAP